jgi:TATA-box binding protein (TBP) (component of TFIID and TFIIIB)
MGCKVPIDDRINLPYHIRIERIQSVTIAENIGYGVNLYKLAKSMGSECFFEPELFTALRFTKYNPLCVNIFATGKVMILGLRNLRYQKLLRRIMNDIDFHIATVAMDISDSKDTPQEIGINRGLFCIFIFSQILI